VAWIDLELEILEDMASYAAVVLQAQQQEYSPDSDTPITEAAYGSGFLIVKLNAPFSLVKRNRPEDLLEQLTELTATRPTGPWTTAELLAGLGWALSKGAPESVGMAMAELGWTKKRDWKQPGYPTVFTRILNSE